MLKPALLLLVTSVPWSENSVAIGVWGLSFKGGGRGVEIREAGDLLPRTLALHSDARVHQPSARAQLHQEPPDPWHPWHAHRQHPGHKCLELQRTADATLGDPEALPCAAMPRIICGGKRNALQTSESVGESGTSAPVLSADRLKTPGTEPLDTPSAHTA